MDSNALKPDLVIFDCDGVLVDSEVLSCQCLCEALGACGIELSVDQALQLFLGQSATAVSQYYRERGQPVPDNFLADLKSRLQKSFTGGLQPIPGVEPLLSSLPMPFCLASSSDHDRVSLSLALTGLASHFGDRLYTSQLVARGKPAPDLFLHAAAQMRAAPGRSLVVEDSVSGVTAGKAAGMTVWAFIGGSHYRSRDGRSQLYGAGADRVFERMADFWSEG
jgi:HAD superfamily hydrolase (TIGR01509 family)